MKNFTKINRTLAVKKNQFLLNLVGRRSYKQCLVSIICLLMLTVGVGNAWGGTYTYDFSTVTDTWYTTSAKTVTVSTGSNPTPPIYYSDGTAWTGSGTSYYFNASCWASLAPL